MNCLHCFAQHRGFNGPEAHGWLRKVFPNFNVDIFPPHVRAVLKDGQRKLLDVIEPTLSVNWVGDQTALLEAAVGRYHAWMKAKIAGRSGALSILAFRNTYHHYVDLAAHNLHHLVVQAKYLYTAFRLPIGVL